MKVIFTIFLSKQEPKTPVEDAIMRFLYIIRVIFVNTDNYSDLGSKKTMDNDWTPKPIKDCFHVYSDGTLVNSLYETTEDHVFMMNRIIISALSCHLRVIIPEVIRTHFHVIVRGSPESIDKFLREIKRLIIRYFRKIGKPGYVKDKISIRADPIPDEDELRRKIIYVFRNCTEAGYPYLPENYPWGPGRVFFQENETLALRHRVGDLSYREQCRLFHTRIKLPGDWEYNNDGMLVPSCYLDLEYVQEEVFTSIRQFLAFLSVKKKDLQEMEVADKRRFLEQKDESALQMEADTDSRRRFGIPIRELSEANRLTLALQYWNERKTFSIKQLARIVHADVAVLKAVLLQNKEF